MSAATKDSEARCVMCGGDLRYIPRRAYVVLNEAEMPLLCAMSNPTPVDSLARLRYSEFLAQRRVRPSVVAVCSERSGVPLHFQPTLKIERAQVACQESEGF